MKLTEQILKKLILEQMGPVDTAYLADSLSGTIKFWAHAGRGALRPGSHRHGAATEEIMQVFSEADPSPSHEKLKDFALFLVNKYDKTNEHQRKLKILAMGGADSYIQAADLASALGLI